jgi:predicted acyltransferase
MDLSMPSLTHSVTAAHRPLVLGPVAAAPQRVFSIDVLRGLTIAFMILVNDPGDWAHVYSQLDHAPWNGFTATDLVFPNFLFLVGVSIVLSLESRLRRGASRPALALHMLRRTATLIAIKLFLSAFPHFHVGHLRLFGVLTRIALCYLAAGLLCLAIWNKPLRIRSLLALTAVLLIGYWALMRFVPVPSFGVPTHAMPILDPARNLAAWLDRAVNAFTQRALHTGSLYNKNRDPEGLLSTLPAIATTLLGCVTGLCLLRVDSRDSRLEFSITRAYFLNGLLACGVAALAAGLLWDRTFPINKNLWTSSYVLFAAGLSLLLLALCYWLIDIRRLNQTRAGRALLWPWLVFGSNAIFAFCFSNLLVEILLWIKAPAGALVNPTAPGTPISAWLWLYLHLFARHHSTPLSSLAFALAFTALCFLPNWLLWRRKLFLKV